MSDIFFIMKFVNQLVIVIIIYVLKICLMLHVS